MPSTNAPGWLRWLAHIGCVLALMWPAIVNRQPFFFPDTTSYVRAGDMAVRVASHGAITTAWSRARYVAPDEAGAAEQGAAATAEVAGGSDSRGGAVMAGRSPYFGALLYLGYVSSDFWLFVLAQAVIAYLLIGMALRAFGLAGWRAHAGTAVLLALFSTVAYYDSLLLADALAGFGILAFLLLATSRETLSRGEILFLVAIVLMSVVSHLTHIVMLLGMTALLALCVLCRWLAWPRARWALVLGAVGIVIGLASVSLTSRVVKAALGKPPALVPLLTARFVADGPGRKFIESGCDGGRFVVCHIPFSGSGSTAFLWSRVAPDGVFMPADPETRIRMSAEDTAFARAVLTHYPLEQGGMIVWNTILQIVMFDSDIMDEGCFARVGCNAEALPPPVLATMRRSLSGQDAWPIGLVRLKDYAGVILAIVAIAAILPRLRRDEPETAARLLLWIALFVTAMLVNGFLGGAVSEPQGRYQARIIWIVPLIGLIGWQRWRLVARRTPADDALPVAQISG